MPIECLGFASVAAAFNVCLVLTSVVHSSIVEVKANCFREHGTFRIDLHNGWCYQDGASDNAPSFSPPVRERRVANTNISSGAYHEELGDGIGTFNVLDTTHSTCATRCEKRDIWESSISSAILTTLKRSARHARTLHTGCNMHTGISSHFESRPLGSTILVADDRVVTNLNIELNGSYC
jgi:hypothetical protein